MTDVLLCVGNSMMGDDGAGPLLAEKCAAAPKGNWVVIDGGSAPENDIVAIRELRPTRLLIVDVHYVVVERDEKYMAGFDEMVPEFIEKMDEALAEIGFVFGEQWR